VAVALGGGGARRRLGGGRTGGICGCPGAVGASGAAATTALAERCRREVPLRRPGPRAWLPVRLALAAAWAAGGGPATTELPEKAAGLVPKALLLLLLVA
jgi:hypothetical protein